MTGATVDRRTVYRPFLTQPGEPPILPDNLGEMLQRRWALQAVTGLDDEHVHTDPLAAFPLPMYDGHRWSGRIEFLWCPLAWLPVPLSSPPAQHSRRGVPTMAMRVWAAIAAYSLGRSGLYSPENGFVDVAATYGIDLSDPAVLLRAQVWCAGGSDPLFDRTEADVHARLLEGLDLAGVAALLDLLGVQRQLIADQLLRSLRAATDPITILPAYLSLARDLLGDMPFTQWEVGDVLLGMLAEVDGPPDATDEERADSAELAEEALEDFTAMLTEIASGVPVGSTS